MIDRLETLGYVERFPDPEDRRATAVEITETGRKAMAEARVVIDRGLEETWARHITDEEATVIVDVMRRVLGDHLGEHRSDAG